MVKLPHNEFCWSSARQPDVLCKSLYISIGLFLNYKIIWRHNGNFKDFKINVLSVSTVEFLCVSGNFCQWVLPLEASLPHGSTSLRRKNTGNILCREQPMGQGGEVSCERACHARQEDLSSAFRIRVRKMSQTCWHICNHSPGRQGQVDPWSSLFTQRS